MRNDQKLIVTFKFLDIGMLDFPISVVHIVTFLPIKNVYYMSSLIANQVKTIMGFSFN